MNCIICLEEKNDENEKLIYPEKCNCKIKIHKECMEKMKNHLGINCPICRQKNDRSNSITIISERTTFDDFVLYIVYNILDFITKNSSIFFPFLFSFYVLFSIFVSLFYVVPFLIFSYIKYKIILHSIRD